MAGPQSNPERLLLSLFIRASHKHPASMSAQGIWLLLLFIQEKETGRISENVAITDLQQVLTSERKGEVYEVLARAAQKAHRHLVKRRDISQEDFQGAVQKNLKDIVEQVLQVSVGCQVFERKMLFSSLEMLDIYLQVGVFVYASIKEELDEEQNPEVLQRKTLINNIIQREFKADLQPRIMQFVDQCLFSNMTYSPNYLDMRFSTFLCSLSYQLRSGALTTPPARPPPSH